MQQKFCSRGSASFLSERSIQSCSTNPVTDFATSSSDLPFRCPRCGERERFGSLGSLRVHLECRHSYRPPDGGFSITGQLPNPLTAAAIIPWYDMSSLPMRGGQRAAATRPPHARSLSDSRDGGYLLHSYDGSARRRTQSVGVGTEAEEEEEEEEGETEDEDGGEEEDDDDDDDGDDDGSRNEEDVKLSSRTPDHHHHHHHHGNRHHGNHNHHPLPFPPPAPLGPPPEPDLDLDLVELKSYSGLETAAASAVVRRRLASILRAADGTMQRRLAAVSSELAQTDTELLCERAHSQHLAQERQEMADRERSLSRQVDVAVMVIAALREQLNASENELERREREVLTIQKFLEAAVRQETCGKVRIQHFIENLLRRIALAEQLVEYYQVNGSPPHFSHCKQQQQTENGPHRITKNRSAGGQLSSSGVHQSSSRFYIRPPSSVAVVERDREWERRERLAQSSRLFCRPENRDDIWNRHQRRRSTGYEA
ncbi:protein ZNF365 [Pholidichthys leucotaenia]